MYFDILDDMFRDFEEYKDIQKGKGVRGKLITIINPEAEKLAAVVEAVHLASLLHDDVIDEADIRRGVKSINAKYGEFSAVMLGDIIYSRAFYELVDFGEKIAKIISNAVYLLSQGELEDVKLSNKINLDKNKYMQMIYKKTASLIEAACRAAALTKGFDENDFGLYGKNIGLAFQIVDDVLDITQDEKTLGKPNMHDFKEGKTTLPYIYLFERLNNEEKEKLVSLFKKDLNENEKNWIKEKMQEDLIIEKCLLEAKNLVDSAKKAIEKYNIQKLEILADKIVNRSK
ncbi:MULTISPECIES: polyprenyl synthetase family protein [unclassified Lebetimonas]|jgi:octaprenyl-diphosphate synthase|uniref:polyprenyl synthetase family protein n=1 Tax=unclassified Lebetimonas TaxID=2648158 RepID=UPI0004670DFD|nr:MULTISPECIES: polyprenyl synthetase family protein [unclassified Lebetimonas]